MKLMKSNCVVDPLTTLGGQFLQPMQTVAKRKLCAEERVPPQCMIR